MSLGMLGKYERLDVLGHGASGIVYLAQDTLLKRRVALKVIDAQGEELHRVLEEARVLDRLRHLNIVAVHGVDTLEGKVVIDMEYVPGSNLLEIIRDADGPIPLIDAVSIAAQICDGLAYAHALRTVHRDIKPANILISNQFVVKLVDFGLAQVLGVNSFAGGAGTFAYMAPEDFAEGGRSDRQSDLWAVGVILYEMLTGRRPFTVETPRDPFAWARAVNNDDLRPPSFYHPAVPCELDAVCLRALQRDKSVRYESAEWMAKDLRLVYSEEPAYRPPLSYVLEEVPAPPAAAARLLDAGDVDEFLTAAPRRWAEAAEILSSGALQRWLETIGEPLLARAAESLQDGEAETRDDRLREFLFQAGLEVKQVARNEAIVGGDLVARGRYADAVETLQRAVNLDPAQASYHRLLADAARLSGDLGAAREFLRRALDRHPSDRALKQDLVMVGGAGPELSVDNISFGRLYHGKCASREVTLWPQGTRLLKGRVAAAPGWLRITPLTFDVETEQIFHLTADTGTLSAERAAYRDKVTFDTMGGAIELAVSVLVAPPQPTFQQIKFWYGPVFGVCLLPAVVGTVCAALSRIAGPPIAFDTGLTAAGLLFCAFTAVAVIADTRPVERIGAAGGALLLPVGIFLLCAAFQRFPGYMAAALPTVAAVVVLTAAVPVVQGVAWKRSREFFLQWKLWCGAITGASLLVSFILGQTVHK